MAVVAACGTSVHDAAQAIAPPSAGPLLTGKDAFGDWTTDAPGVRRKLTVADLPKPYDTPSVDRGPQLAPAPEGALPKAPAGFTVRRFAQADNPRVIQAAPNGDLFVVESGPGRVKVLRDTDGDGVAETVSTFATGLVKPFGLAFYPAGPNPTHVYVANTDAIIRFPYTSGDLKAKGGYETVVDNVPGFGRLRGGGHWTRDIVFSKDGRRLFVSVGSLSNVNDDPEGTEKRRAAILSFTPDGGDEKLYASGIRNPVGLAIDPRTGTLWTSVNERDELGDMLVPDYVTSVREGGFYGWPWYYLGGNQDPRHAGKRPELKDKVIVPDVLLQAHSASLDLTFAQGAAFPKRYQNGIFAAEHGSWNRARRTGYKVVFIPLEGKGKASGEYEDFLTGFVIDDNQVWGRPVGVTVAKDGALYVTDDGSGAIWRVAYTGAKR